MNSSLLKIKILVVDDDSTSLAIIAAMLKGWRYEVATVKTPVDALSTLRAHPGIDLVVTDLHMPEMNGIELQRQINQEFKLPVIIMSADDKESVMLESLARGAVFFIVKPVKPDDLKNVWQYAIAAKKGKSVVTEGIESTEGESSSAGKLSKGEITSVLSVNNAKRGSKRKESRKGKDDQEEEEEEEEEETASAPKKAKVVWTSSLHNQFLEALRRIGLEKAVPKKILEHMNVQGLTRENVASHLQKYRIFLKRVAERRCFSSKMLAERVLKSKFASGHPLLWKTAQEYSRLQEMQRMGGLAFRSGYGGSFSAHNAARLGSILFPNQNAPSRNSAQPHGYGQSSLLGNQADKRQVSGNTSTLYQGNRLGYAYGSNLSLNGSLSGGLINASNGLMNGANSMHTHKKQIQARPDFYNAGSSSEFRFGSPGLHTWNSTPGTGNIGSIGTSYPTLNSSCTNNDNYAGFRLTTDGQLFGMGQTRLNGSCGIMNGTCNQNLNFAAMGNQGFCFISQGGFSSTGLDGANRVSPTNTAANQQANISTLPGLGNRGVTEYNSDHMMNNVSNLENITLSQQPVDGYLSDLLLESNNNQFPNQQQVGGDGVQNPAFASSSLFPEIYPTLEDLNSDFSDLLTLEETAPRNEKDLGQVQKGNEELMNTNVGGGAYTFDESNRTNFNQNTIQQLRGGEHFTGSDQLSSVFPVNNAPASGDDSSDNQKWGDDFVDSLFSFGPHFE